MIYLLDSLPNHNEYDPIARQITEMAWSPDGKNVVLGHVSQAERGGQHLPSTLYLLTFEGACGNQIQPICGNGICEPGETKLNCIEDCRPNVVICGDGICDIGETYKNCPEDCRKQYQLEVKSITTIKEYGKSLDWSYAKDLIAFGKHGRDGYYDVHVMEPDGSDEQCLTCDKEGCPQKHNGNPAWHPSGDYIVFTAEKKENSEEHKEWAVPGTGFNCDLWMTTSDGQNFYQLTDYPITHPWKAIIHPQFSHDGKKLFWAERIEQGDSFGGGWVLKIADFVSDGKEPHLEDISICEPGEWSCFYESHAFSKDDESIVDVIIN